jgi:two-component system, OmpR family, sensor histidine kinase PhoQ
MVPTGPGSELIGTTQVRLPVRPDVAGKGFFSARTPAITTRLILASALALSAFLTLTGWALDRAFERSAVKAIQLRLQGYFYSLLQESDVNRKGKLLLSDRMPQADFDRPASGLYAGVRGPDFYWLSPSALGREMPFTEAMTPGEFSFKGPVSTPAVGNMYVFSSGVTFDIELPIKPGIVQADTPPPTYTFFVAEHENSLLQQKAAFRRTLTRYLGGFGLLLLFVQGLLLRLSLNPLRHVAKELAEVERGTAEELIGPYPAELEGLTSSLNRVIGAERDNLKRYRNTLGDLAHSLKTPLAVMRGLLDSEPEKPQLIAGTEDQIRRMNEIVAYQLARAASSGHKTFAKPMAIDKNAEEIVQSLEKVYAVKGVLCEFELDEAARFHGELGDVMEVLGNLLDNGFKWAESRVVLTTRQVGNAKSRRMGLEICVEDDGPGIPEAKMADMLKRGVRGDERVHGHGIGLSTVSNVMESYQGQLNIDRSPELGGARFSAVFPPL